MPWRGGRQGAEKATGLLRWNTGRGYPVPMFGGLLKWLEKPSGPELPRIRILPAWGTTTRTGALLLGLTIAGAALAVGTVHTVTLCAVTSVLALAAALTWARADAT